jgi:hypothetical protein
MPFGAVIVNVSCSDHGDPEPVGEPAEVPVPIAVPLLLIVLKLDEKAPGAEGGVQAPGEELGCGRAVFQRPRQRALPAPAEGDEPLCACEEGREQKSGPPAFTPEVRLTQEPAEVGITSRSFGQEGHMTAPGQRVSSGIVHPQPVHALRDPRNIESHRDLGAGDGLKSFGAGRLGKFHGPVQAVVICERHGGIAQLESPQDQLFGMRGPIQEGEAGVAVEFDVRRRGHDIRFLFG